MIDCVFANYIDLKALYEKYGLKRNIRDVFRIGFDGRIYVLIETESVGENRGRYSVLILDVDWDDEKLISSSCYNLGEFYSAFYHIQPIGENILMVDCRSSYNKGNPEKNAMILTLGGEVLERFCFGDGIQDVYVRPDNTIVTSYFDEGVFGNLGWGDPGGAPPIGASGLVVWNEKGEQLFSAKHNIFDCYALNVDSNNDIWYYYYDEFKLVRSNGDKEIDFDPHIAGASFFALTEDGQKVIFDSGYDKYGTYEVYDLYKNTENEKLRFFFEESELLITNYRSYGSKAFFIDNNNRLYLKRFISV